MNEKSEEYIKGYEQGVKDFAEKLQKYYNAICGATFATLVEYTIDKQAKEMLKGEGK